MVRGMSYKTAVIFELNRPRLSPGNFPVWVGEVSRVCLTDRFEMMRRGMRCPARSDDDQYLKGIWGGGATQPGNAERKQQPNPIRQTHPNFGWGLLKGVGRTLLKQCTSHGNFRGLCHLAGGVVVGG